MMLFLYCSLQIFVLQAYPVASLSIHGYKDIAHPDGNGLKQNEHTISKRTVPLKDEVEFYNVVRKIKPGMLQLLMPNITTEGPYIRTPPSNQCCYNGGTCFVPTYERSDRFCTCPPNFQGRYCKEDVNECESPTACGEHEVCNNTYGSYNCTCQENYIREGLTCIAKSSCYEDPCLNFAECLDVEEGRVLCLCRLGYKGTRCEMKAQECEDSSCNENDICVASPSGFQCVKT